MQHEDDLVEIETQPCIYCGRVTFMAVDVEGLKKYRAGAFVQDAFPRMTPEGRELLISGTCPECWDRYIRPPEDF